MAVFKLCSVRSRRRIHYSKKKEKTQPKKTRPRKTVGPPTKRNGWFSSSNLGMYVKNKISSNVSLIIACTQRSDVLFSFSFFWKTSACARVRRARAQSEGGAQERKISIFFFPHPYPFALAVNKSPAVFFFFIRRARRTLKRK